MTASFTASERPRPAWIRDHPRSWIAAVGTVCFGAFMGQFDASVVALTYRPIGQTFHAGLSDVQWVTLSYLAALAVLLVPLGRLSDRLGRKRVYLWGFGLFTIASAGCALAPGLGVLVGVRAIQGVGAAMLQANSIALVATAAPRSRLRRALGVQAAAQAIGLALGPSIGGVLVQTIGWRWVFAVNVPIGIAAIIAGRQLLPRTRFEHDVPPARAAAVLRSRGVPSGLAGGLLAYLVLFGPIVLVPMLLQQAGSSAARAGLVVGALPVGFALAATGADRLLAKDWSIRRRSLAGLATSIAGLVGLAAAGTQVWGCAVALLAVGVGLGIYLPANNAAIMAAVPASASALAGGLVSAGRAAGTAAGTAVVAATLTAAGNGRLAIAVLIGGVLLTAVLAITGTRPRGSAPADTDH